MRNLKKLLNQEVNLRSSKVWLTVIPLFLILVGLFANLSLLGQRQTTEKQAAGESASLELPSSLKVNVGDEFNLPVMVNTGGETIAAAGVILEFDKEKLKLIDITPKPENSSLMTYIPTDTKGVFKNQEVLAQANQEGKLKFGAVAFDWQSNSKTTGFNGILGPANPLVLLRFKTVNTGSVAVNFNFTPNLTTDSNLVRESDAADILSRVTNLSLEIVSP